MAVRVEPDDVRNVIATSLDDEVIAAHIEAANAMVEHHLADADVAPALLTQIELFLAAHFVALRDPAIASITAGPSSRTYKSARLGSGLDATEWGQQARLLDPTGKLARASREERRPFVYLANAPEQG